MAARIGYFLFFMGFLVMIVFVASTMAQDPQFILFFAAALLMILGGIQMFKSYEAPPPPDTHFGLFHRNRGKEDDTQSTRKEN
jgi:hypothetical protein